MPSTPSTDVLRDIVRRNRAGEPRGIWAACTAHPLALEACIEEARSQRGPLLVEATSNQVNQLGGYTGQTPAAFRDRLLALAASLGFPAGRLILGGDHLGPNPWQAEPAAVAMDKARALVAAYAEAGFAKIHLDASMPLGGYPFPLPPELVARRAADLCATAEASAGAEKPVYVIGTEVPTPGGAREALDHVEVTLVADLEDTIDLHRRAFAARGLDEAWRRVIAVVVQPGVEFGHADVMHFVPAAAADLKAAIAAHGELAFEAHSTDYQRPDGLRALVDSHFAVLKVGPWLTFALREAVFALDDIERELLPDGERAGARQALEAAMLADPTHWRAYYLGSGQEQAFARAFSLSDRSRYYWALPQVGQAVERLVANLAAAPLPLPLLSQYLPAQHAAVHEGRLPNEPRALIKDKVREVARIYAAACGTPAAP